MHPMEKLLQSGKIKVFKAQKSDAKRGWVRINSKVRGSDIKREGIYKITVEKDKSVNSVYRMVLGNNKIQQDDEVILIDRFTRDELGVELKKEYNFTFKPAVFHERWFHFYWYHPDYTFRAGYRLAWGLGIIAVVLGLIGLIMSFLSLVLGIVGIIVSS